MGIRTFGEVLLTSDLDNSTLRVSQKVIFNKDEALMGCQTAFVVYNNPTFTSLSMQIYSNRSSAPGKLIATSTNTLLKASITTLSNAMKIVYFDFSNVNLRGTDTYYFVPKAVGYIGTSSSHLAWVKAWPDPVYRTNVNSGYGKLGIAPYYFSFVGANLS